MNSEANDSTDAAVSAEDVDTLESIGETSGESRTDRIRRLNRERQRRRREKLRMSRQSEAPSTTGNDPSHDLELLSEGCTIVEVTLPLKVETEIPEEADKTTSKPTRPKRSTRTRQKSRREAAVEQTKVDTVSSANNAISAPQCHDNNSKFDGTSDESTVLVVASEVEVVDEKPQENGTEEFTETPENKTDGKKRRLRESAKSLAEKSVEEVETKRVVREREKKKMHGLLDEVTARREKQRELKRKQKERMSSDQIEALRARYREWRRKRKETMTSEQLEIIRKGNRERQRRRRERLGIRKRSTAPQAKGASEAVIQGIKNKQQAQIIKPVESNLSPEASLVAAVNQVASLNSVEAAAAAAALVPNPPRIEGPVAVTVEVNPAAPGVAPAVIQNTQTVAQPPSSAPQLVGLPVTSTNVTQGTLPPGLSVLGPQGTILQGLPPGSLYSMSMPGIQLPGIPATAGQALPGIQGNTVAGMPFAGMQGLMQGIPGQGTFLSTSQAGVLPGMQTFSSMAPTMTKDGQILHSISTLLPLAPVQGIQGTGQGVAFLAPMPMAGPAGQAFQDLRGTVSAPIRTHSPGVGTVVASVPIADSVTAETVAVVTPGDGADDTGLDPKTKNSTSPKPRGRRGRKRTTSAAEMLANLSNLPPTSTPMSTMLSALASQVRENSQPPVVAVEKNGEPPGKRAAFEATQVATAKITAPSQDLTQTSVAVGNEATVRANVVTLPELQPTGTFPMSNSGAKIPHMSTFLNTMGGNPIPNMAVPFATAAGLSRPINTFPPNIQGAPGQLFTPRVSVAVETEEIRKTTVGTNTENNQQAPNNSAEQAAVMSSIGTMTDSLYKVSVGTVTGQTIEQPTSQETQLQSSNIVEESMAAAHAEINSQKINPNSVSQEISPVDLIQVALNPEQMEPVVVIPEDVVEEVVEVTEVAKITPIGEGM